MQSAVNNLANEIQFKLPISWYDLQALCCH